jgi:hypothetical protein
LIDRVIIFYNKKALYELGFILANMNKNAREKQKTPLNVSRSPEKVSVLLTFPTTLLFGRRLASPGGQARHDSICPHFPCGHFFLPAKSRFHFKIIIPLMKNKTRKIKKPGVFIPGLRRRAVAAK